MKFYKPRASMWDFMVFSSRVTLNPCIIMVKLSVFTLRSTTYNKIFYAVLFDRVLLFLCSSEVQTLSKDQLRHMEGTVILHITFAVKQDQDLGKEFVKYFKVFRGIQ